MQGKILIIDDDIDTLQLVGTMLERQGFSIVAANNGEQGLLKAQTEKPELIITDVMMPGMDGYEVTRRLRASEATAHTPILMFTAKSQMDDKVEGFEVGVDDYITKPIHPAELIASVKKLLARPVTGMLTMPEEMSGDELAGSEITLIVSSKGGLGVSTLAINLAIATQEEKKEEVLLVDFRPGVGDIGTYMGHMQATAIDELLTRNVAEIRVVDIEERIIQDASGIRLLLSSHNPNNIELSQATSQAETITRHLKSISKNIFIDIGVGVTDLARKLVPMCDRLVVVVEPSAPVVVHTRQLIESFKKIGVAEEKIKPVMLSRQRLEIALSAQKVQQGLNSSLVGVIAAAPELAFQSQAKQQALMMHSPESIVARQFRRLAGIFMGIEDKNK